MSERRVVESEAGEQFYSRYNRPYWASDIISSKEAKRGGLLPAGGVD